MNALKPTQFYDITVPANGAYRLLVAGDYFKLMTATGAVNVQADWGELRGLIGGQGLEESNFSYLNFTDVSGASNPIRVFIGDKKFIDGLGGTINVGTNNVPLSAAFANLQKTVTSTSAQLLAANANRKYLLIQNKDTAGNLYIGFGAGAVTAANGIRVIPGGSYELPGGICTTQEIRAIGDIASNANVTTVEG
ncbi:hypothetical protein [Acidovorax sp. LjRoot194]|uniref:hypothetical protein n=1 Tax=Acidovorax sp. LjRoot194 TaxID=3342280 RepID=UPI003ECDDA05